MLEGDAVLDAVLVCDGVSTGLLLLVGEELGCVHIVPGAHGLLAHGTDRYML